MRTLPNAISVLRAVSVVPVVLLLDPPAIAMGALAVFALAAMSDAIDGPLARRLGAVSRLGAFLDPLADKVLVLGTLGALVARGAVDPLPVQLIVAREVVVTAVRGAAATRSLVIVASAYGKAKAALQILAVGGQLVVVAFPDLGLATVADAALLLAVLVTLVSGVDVVRRATALLASPTPRPAAVDAR